jgi:hypothetical protein
MTTRKQLEVGRATKLNQRVRLVGVDVHRLAAQHLGAVQGPRYGYHLAIGNVSFAEVDDTVVAVLPLTVQIHHKDQDRATPLASIEVDLRLGYRREGAALDESERDVLPDFLGIVGWMHAWPYARAEVQSLTTKLGFPPLVLPLLHAGATAGVLVEQVEAETGAEDAAADDERSRER